ncbi:MAG: uracil-DNA glycosylase [Phycisphaerae bacterium]|nr:uracil-DNA glycosylase [Phycisphaerae bacterium]
MSDDRRKLQSTARQMLEGELLFSDPFLPAGRNPLPPPAASAAGAPAMTAEERAAALQAMDVNEVRGCTKCRLHQGRTQTVFGEGSPTAQIVFIGEAPGEEEDRTGRPFVGRAGELLTRMITAMGLKRSDVYICNVVKCRPPGNRSPAADEADACRDYLLRQLQILAPAVLVTLGNPATQKLLDTPVGITKLRGQWQKLPLLIPGLGGIDVMPTFHPAFVLRQYTADVRSKVWADLQEVMARLNLPAPPRRKGAGL